MAMINYYSVPSPFGRWWQQQHFPYISCTLRSQDTAAAMWSYEQDSVTQYDANFARKTLTKARGHLVVKDIPLLRDKIVLVSARGQGRWSLEIWQNAASLTDTTSIPVYKFDVLFEFSQQGRHDLRTFIDSFPSKDWDVPQDLTIGKYSLKATPKKIVIHILMHEIRHWAQIATLLRLQGMKDEFHDFLFSPVFSVEHGSEKG